MAEADVNQVITNGIKLTGEALVAPSTSLILDGQIIEGGLHAIVGLLAGAFGGSILGPIGWIAVAANSYSRSATGKNLLQQVGFGTGSSPAPSTSSTT